MKRKNEKKEKKRFREDKKGEGKVKMNAGPRFIFMQIMPKASSQFHEKKYSRRSMVIHF